MNLLGRIDKKIEGEKRQRVTKENEMELSEEEIVEQIKRKIKLQKAMGENEIIGEAWKLWKGNKKKTSGVKKSME